MATSHVIGAIAGICADLFMPGDFVERRRRAGLPPSLLASEAMVDTDFELLSAFDLDLNIVQRSKITFGGPEDIF